MKLHTLQLGNLNPMLFLVSEEAQAALQIHDPTGGMDMFLCFFFGGTLYGIHKHERPPEKQHYEFLLAAEISRQVGFEIKHIAWDEQAFPDQLILTIFISGKRPGEVEP